MDRQLLDRRQLVVSRLVTVDGSHGATPPLHRRRVLPLRGTGGRGGAPVWLLTAVLLGGSAALLAGAVPHGSPSAGPFTLPWWAVAGGFFLAEVAVVHYDFRREAHSFSMNELPLTFGLFFATAPDLIAGVVLGAGAALVLHRRQTGLKLLFNLGHFAFGTCLAVLVFRAVAGGASSFAPLDWLAVLLAAVAASVLSTAAIFTAISLSERRLDIGKLPEQLGLALLTTAGSASLGLLGVAAAWQHPAGVGLLAVPVATFLLAHRRFVLERQERDKLQFLHRVALILDEAPDIESALSRTLHHVCEAFRAEVAQFALISPQQPQLALLVTATADTVQASGYVHVQDVDGLLHRALRSTHAHTLTLNPAVPDLGVRALGQVLVGPLRGEPETGGAILVGNRLSAAGGFGERDLHLLETLVTQVNASLDRGRLARALTETARRADRERDNALVLQRGILPPEIPAVPGASVAVRYLPGDTGVEVGGDWYDAIELPCGDVAFAIGDVLGHNLEAAARMGQARSALRAYATDGHRPAAVIERLNRLLTRTDPDFMGTCCYLQFSPGSHFVTLVSAGHPPPLFISADGQCRFVNVDPNLPLGVHETARYAATTLTLPPGATLALYTDGLVESSNTSLDVGLRRLAALPLSTGQGDLEFLADEVLAHASVGVNADDRTLLLLRRHRTHATVPAATGAT
jgi:serine phosphatase RsbU (regulator of sigma subunit)